MVQEVEVQLQESDSLLTILRYNLKDVQNRIEQYVDLKHRSEEFEEGD